MGISPRSGRDGVNLLTGTVLSKARKFRWKYTQHEFEIAVMDLTTACSEWQTVIMWELQYQNLNHE